MRHINREANRCFTRNLTACGAVLTLLTLVPAAVGATEQQRSFQHRLSPQPGLVVEIENLAGHVTIEPASGGEGSIEATVTASDDSAAEAQALASLVEVTFVPRGDRLVVHAHYPVERYDTYHYPQAGDGGSWPFGGGSRSTTRYQGQRVTVVSRPRGGAVTLYTDFVLRLPPGVGATVDNVAGDLDATGVQGPLAFDTSSGSLRATSGEGSVAVDTGSGDVAVSDYHGEVDADTGSGDVTLRHLRGTVRIDTGSGDVELEDVEGERIVADTGSGDIRFRDVRGELDADTGSGDVEARDLVARGRLRADTGSGEVTLAGDLSGLESLVIETGSGDVTVDASRLPPMDLTISTGSGGMDVDLPGAEVLRRDEDSYEARIQGGGARASIETGSGRVRFRQAG